jgi:hypothetical protein
VIYVPVYLPDQVYYQTDYGPPFITFGIGFPIGLWLNCDFDWGHHHVIVWHRDHPRPPNWWHEHPHQRDPGHATVWQPHNYPGVVGLNRGDRGWSVANNGTTTPIAVGRSPSDTVAPRRTPAPTARPEAPVTRASMPIAQPAPAPVEHAQPISRPESNGAFIGIKSSHDTKTYSDRGQQSMQTVTRSEPVSRPAPAMPSGGGGGGHSSGSSNRR